MSEMEFESDGFEYINETNVKQPKDKNKKFRKGLLIGKNGACKSCFYSSEKCIIKGCKVHCSCKRPRVLWNERKCNWFCHSYNFNGEKK